MCAMPSEPTELPVHALSAAIRSRKLSPVELTDALLARIERLDGKLHAFIALYATEARLAHAGPDPLRHQPSRPVGAETEHPV